jgi:hypothetical protein
MDWHKIEATWRPAPFWSWNDAMNSEELARQIREMAERGWGGFFMHARVGLVTGYLSPQWMDLVRTCIGEAKATGTAAWLYDEDKWPSGFAGGEVPEAAEAYRSRALVLLKKEELTDNDTVLAEARDKYIAKRIAPLGNLWFNGASYVDLMNPEAVKFFFQTTHERYAKEVGVHFGKEIPGIFTDEPCYLMEGHYDVPVVPWSEYLPNFFQKLKGYKIEEHLIELFFDEGDYQKVRFDFYDAATKLFRDSFGRQYYEWCNQNNLKLTGHYMAEDNLTYQTQWVGAAMPHYEFMHWPGIDKLGRNLDQLLTVKQLTSVADQLAKERSFCEVFGCTGQQNSFFHRKWIGDWQAVLGINFVNEHLSLYSMRGERKRDYPPNIFYQQPWWEEEAQFAEYLGRVSKAISQGKRALDILVLHPISSVWSLYSPLHKAVDLAPEQTIEVPFRELSKALIEAKLDFHYGDEIIMEEHARVQGAELVVGCHKYGTVVIPPCFTLRRGTMELLHNFQKAGGRIIFLQKKLRTIDGDKPVTINLSGESFDTVEEVITYLDKHYPERIQIVDRETAKNAKQIICHQRELDTGSLFFLANTNQQREIPVTITLPAGTENVAIIDLLTGDQYQAPLKSGKLGLTFYPAGSILLFASQEKRSLPAAPLSLESGIAFPCQLQKELDLEKWQVETLDHNVLPIHKVTLELAGKRVLTQAPIARAWNQHFYPAPDGTPFRAEYSFTAQARVTDLVAVVEMAENLEQILLDGREVKPLKEKGEVGVFNPEESWLDPNFTKVPLGTVEEGSHTLTLLGKKVNNITGPGWHKRVADFQNHHPTEVETVYLVGKFSVTSFAEKEFSLSGYSAPGQNLTASGFPFYAGKAKFETNFTVSPGKRLILELGQVEAAAVKIILNGKELTTLRWAPYTVEITNFLQAGENKLELIAATNLFNLMGPSWIAGIEEDEFVGPGSFIDFSRYTEKYTLLPFGLGKARLWQVK